MGERIDGEGRIRTPLDRAEVAQVISELAAEGVEAIAVCLVNSFTNPVHERAIQAIARDVASGVDVCISYEVLPEIKEYERTSTTVINAYLVPIVSRYLERLSRELSTARIEAPLLLMQSNGGLTTAGDAARAPCNIVESGPAGGVVGAQVLSRHLAFEDLITFDMGGTTAKASLIEGGEVTRSLEYSVGAGIMIGSRLLTGAGYQLKVPAVDLAEVGAGGGSEVWIDPAGSLQIGPRSAGAEPGPVCYDHGGEIPTVTDANLLLGYVNPDYLVGGALPLNADRARRIFEVGIARPLGLSWERAAYGAHQIAASNMIRAIRAVSTERGRDPRRYALFAIGGNGPLFACGIARSLGGRHVVVPPAAGLFSAFGLLYADVEHHYSRTLRRVLSECDPGEIGASWRELEDAARVQLEGEGFPVDRIRLVRRASLHYQGQMFELAVPAPEGAIDRAALDTLSEAFGREHERTYGHRAGPEEPVELVSIVLVGQGIPDSPRVPERLLLDGTGSRADEPIRVRDAYFGPEIGWLTTPVIGRARVGSGRTGPFIVEEYDSTCVVPPDAAAKLDDYGNLRVTLSG